MDFPILERIYYALVAGFDVFGNAAHQLGTRLYMDHLRMQSEANFLAFLPAARREEIRAEWYRGAEHQLTHFAADRIRSQDFESEISYRTDDPVREFVMGLLALRGGVTDPVDVLNRCPEPPCRPCRDRTDRWPAG